MFPGGVGTAEEILYLLGLLLDPANASQPFPLVFTGPASAAEYFRQIDAFVRATLGDGAAARYQVILDNPAEVARVLRAGLDEVKVHRKTTGDAYFFNWTLNIPHDFQLPFVPTHENMAALDLGLDQPAHRLAANLRRAFSGIVAGNVKEEGRRAIEAQGPFEIHGDAMVMALLDKLLQSFVAQHRMRLPGVAYEPCYRLVA